MIGFVKSVILFKIEIILGSKKLFNAESTRIWMSEIVFGYGNCVIRSGDCPEKRKKTIMKSAGGTNEGARAAINLENHPITDSSLEAVTLPLVFVINVSSPIIDEPVNIAERKWLAS